MLHITGLYASILGFLIIFLAYRVVNFRKTKRVGIGDNGDKLGMRAIRVHANATEYIPILIILMAIYELNGGAVLVLHIIGIISVFARILHAFGLSGSSGISFGRFYGTAITWVSIVGLSCLNIYQFLLKTI